MTECAQCEVVNRWEHGLEWRRVRPADFNPKEDSMGYMADQNRTVAANGTTASIVAGKPYEYLSRRCLLRIAPVAAAVGINIFVTVGDRNIVTDEPISSANRWPIDPDDYIFKIPGAPGQKVDIRLRNTTGAGIIVNTVIDVVELE